MYELRGRLAPWLLRPFIDLGPFACGPLYARGIEEYWRAFIEPALPQFALQRTLPSPFRSQLIRETGEPRYEVRDPRQLPSSLQTERWKTMCDALDSWNELPTPRRCRLAALMHSLCLYEPVLKLASPPGAACADDPFAIELAYWRESARYVLGLPERVADYQSADLSAFEMIARNPPVSAEAAFNAAVKIFVHKAKTEAPLAEIGRWAKLLEQALADAVARLDAFTATLLTSRYYRATAFLPQRRKDRAAVVQAMDMAEQHARALKPATRAEELRYLENLHPVLESRTKEAIWLGDSTLALARARQVVDLDPYDSKAWVELGEVYMKREEWEPAAEAYVVAAMLGPPASAVGRYMAGVCYREIGKDFLAAFLFKETLEVDPLGISPRDQIRMLPDVAVLKALKEWNRRAAAL